MTNGHFCKTAEKSETKKRSCYERLKLAVPFAFWYRIRTILHFPIDQQASKSIQYVPLSNGGLARDLCSSTVAFVKRGYWPRFL